MQNVHNRPQEKPTLDDDGQEPCRPDILVKVYNNMVFINIAAAFYTPSLADEGLIKPVLAKVLPFTEESLDDGFTLLKSRRTVGKIVFDMTI